MMLWLNLKKVEHRLVNMNLVRLISHNNPSDPSQGSMLWFDENHHIIVYETLDEIYDRLAKAVT